MNDSRSSEMKRRGANDLSAYWMPFTANRQFQAHPRVLVGAEGMYFTKADGGRVLDATSGMWCVNAGHGRKEIARAVADQIARLDYAPAFQMGHPGAFDLAQRLTAMLPGDLDHVFFVNSGSEAVETALKIALAYHQARSEGSRRRFIGRDRAYHGAGFAGTAVGGIGNNRKAFGDLGISADHLVSTYDPAAAFTRGEPEQGAVLADDLERLVALHGAATIAAVIVEPFAGSAGVLVPPKGYLSRLREICDRHGILLIFDEVITGFGRIGAPFAADRFGVLPDMMTLAKGLTNGTVPMGAVAVRHRIYETMMATDAPETAVELAHGYTYSGHPVACAAALAALDIYENEALFARAKATEPDLEDAAHSLRGLPHVIDIRNIGMAAAIQLEPREGRPNERAFEAYLRCFERGLLIRTTGDTMALSPPLIVTKDQLGSIAETLSGVLKSLN